MKFKIGDRVRIRCQQSPRNGCAGTIIGTPYAVRYWGPHARAAGISSGESGYPVEVDGHGTQCELGMPLTYPSRFLEPIQPLSSWDEFEKVTGLDIRQKVLA